MCAERDFYQLLRASNAADCKCVCVCVMAISGQDLKPLQISPVGHRAAFLTFISRLHLSLHIARRVSLYLIADIPAWILFYFIIFFKYSPSQFGLC